MITMTGIYNVGHNWARAAYWLDGDHAELRDSEIVDELSLGIPAVVVFGHQLLAQSSHGFEGWMGSCLLPALPDGMRLSVQSPPQLAILCPDCCIAPVAYEDWCAAIPDGEAVYFAVITAEKCEMAAAR